MTTSARTTAFSADFAVHARLALDTCCAGVVAACAAPRRADARTARMGGGYDGIWNVLIITQAGTCDPAYSYPFQVSGSRISSTGAADVAGSVSRGGSVVVRISAARRAWRPAAAGSAAAPASARWSGENFPAATAAGAGRRRGAESRSRRAASRSQRPQRSNMRRARCVWPGTASSQEMARQIVAGHHKCKRLTRLSAAPAPSPPDGLRNARPARPWRIRPRRP